MDRPSLSALDLSIVSEGSTSEAALAATTETAQLADRLGFERFWVAEHHNMSSVASTEPAVLIAHLAAKTERIRLGSGGVMLPNHPPLVIAEQFAMLEALHPGRIDLGIGRAPGSDPWTAQALRGERAGDADSFPSDLVDLMGLLGDVRTTDGLFEHLRATPAAESSPLIALLGSSDYSAQLAGHLGLPFGFAHHFGMGGTSLAADLYRQRFQPSPVLDEPHLIVTAVAVAADTALEAERLMASHRLFKFGLASGQRVGVFDPESAMDHPAWPQAEAMPTNAVFGTPDDVCDGLDKLAVEMGAQELMITTPVVDVSARLHSLELVSRAWTPDGVKSQHVNR